MYRSIYIQNNIVHAFDQNNIFIENKNRRFIARLRKSEKPETHQNCPITSKYHLSLSILYYISDDVKRHHPRNLAATMDARGNFHHQYPPYRYYLFY